MKKNKFAYILLVILFLIMSPILLLSDVAVEKNCSDLTGCADAGGCVAIRWNTAPSCRIVCSDHTSFNCGGM